MLKPFFPITGCSFS